MANLQKLYQLYQQLSKNPENDNQQDIQTLQNAIEDLQSLYDNATSSTSSSTSDEDFPFTFDDEPNIFSNEPTTVETFCKAAKWSGEPDTAIGYFKEISLYLETVCEERDELETDSSEEENKYHSHSTSIAIQHRNSFHRPIISASAPSGESVICGSPQDIRPKRYIAY